MSLFPRLRRRLRSKPVTLVHHPGYTQTIPHIPMDPERGERVAAFLRGQGFVGPRAIIRPDPADLSDVLRVHSAEYVVSLDSVEVVSQAVGVPLTDLERQRAVDHQRLVTGGTIRAVMKTLRTRRIAVNLGGGMHHATPTQGMGFCLINDIAVAVAHARHCGFAGRVLVVDLDLHDGNGTRAAFAADSTVHTFSIHNQDWEPREAIANTTIALGSAVDDARLLEVLHESLPPVVRQHRPHLVIYVAGTDPAADDRMGDWCMTTDGLLARDQFVLEAVHGSDARLPLAMVLAGGYGRSAWRHTARFLSWVISGNVLEPPDDLEIMLRRYRLTTLPREARDDWSLTESDLFAVIPGSGPGTRVLGVLSRHAIEVSLEAVGILDLVRKRGFPHPAVDIVLDAGTGETIRLYGDSERTQLLMELRVNRNRRLVPDAEMLYIEWLLLQDPRVDFPSAQPRLPGQTFPGLGMFREVVAWLVHVCEQLQLDGIASVPAQYFMAVLGRHHLRFVEPEAAARFTGLAQALGGLPLAQAEEALALGRVVDAATGTAVRWEPSVAVYPVSRKLRARLAQQPAPEPRRYALRP